MSIQRLRCEWSGSAIVGGGVSTFYAEADGTLAIQVGAAGFWGAVIDKMPFGTTVTIPGTGDVIDEATGTLEGVWGSGTTTTLVSAGPGDYASGVGARVVWDTDAIQAGRRVRGSTFVVPLLVSEYGSDGTLDAGMVTSLETAISDMLVQVPTQMRVWSRPTPGRAGVAAAVVGGRAPDRVSWLRSRRT